ncbi:MAG: DUF2849 domain-containing protein [Sandaracinaceae bacterium]|nr:DUF2849 domain-containing protein [Sandaracinaceae bacterium]
MTLWTVTANHLSDGSVAYLRADRAWTQDLQHAWVGATEADAAPLLAWARGQEHLICDPYLLEVSRDAGRVVPLSARERIRAEGPEATLARLGYERRPELQRKVG